MNHALPTDYQHFIHLSRYARWRDDLGRRETWEETVTRYFDFFVDFLDREYNYKVKKSDLEEYKEAVLNLDVMPSMRCLMTAGRALERDPVAGYNCAYLAVDHPRAFDETLFVLMCGTGVGFSVERQYVNRLPEIPESFERSDTVIRVRDSKRGWAEALREVVAMLYAGRIPTLDVSGVRGKGARLKTMGGRASGPEPFERLVDTFIRVFQNAAGRKLNSLECHDLMCVIGDCVVVGGVRRSALISLSNLSDQRMRDAKAGQWWIDHPERALANNSVAYTETPEVGQFMQEWISLYQSKSGERGFFNREAAWDQATKNGRRRGYWDEEETKKIEFGVNPCSEIILRPMQFCNLTEAVVRPGDSWERMRRKVYIAAVLGTWQACLTKFRYLRKAWKDNCEEERLLGVSLTGVTDVWGDTVRDVAHEMSALRTEAVTANTLTARAIGINPAAAVTCVKPSGTVSQLVDVPAGMHPWHSRCYIRRVRQDEKDPLTQFMIDAGFPHEPDVTKQGHVVFSFPHRARDHCLTRDNLFAVDHLNMWLAMQDHWCEHKPSITVTVRDHEWPEVGAWVWEHFGVLSGVSFLPHTDHTYTQAPYETVDDEALEALEGRMPKNVDWSGLSGYETEDNTVESRELACSAGMCEI